MSRCGGAGLGVPYWFARSGWKMPLEKVLSLLVTTWFRVPLRLRLRGRTECFMHTSRETYVLPLTTTKAQIGKGGKVAAH